MKFKLVVVDLEISARARRRMVWLGALAGVLLVGAAVAYSSVPNTFSSGQLLSAQALNDNFAAVTTPPGTVVAFAGPVVPNGWLLCDGSAVNRTTYAPLFMAIGTTSGSGDGASTFNLPNYQGMFLRGLDATGTVDPDVQARTQAASGGNKGALVGSYQADQFAAHTHNALFYNTAGPTGNILSTTTGPSLLSNPGGFIGSTGGNETRPKNVAVNFIIKT